MDGNSDHLCTIMSSNRCEFSKKSAPFSIVVEATFLNYFPNTINYYELIVFWLRFSRGGFFYLAMFKSSTTMSSTPY